MKIRYVSSNTYENDVYQQKYYIQVKRFGFVWYSVKNLQGDICYFDTLINAINFAKAYYSHFLPSEKIIVKQENNYRIIQEKFVDGDCKYTIQLKTFFFWKTNKNVFKDYDSARKSVDVLLTKDTIITLDVDTYKPKIKL